MNDFYEQPKILQWVEAILLLLFNLEKKVINKKEVKRPVKLHEVQPFNFLIVTYSIIGL
jgi:hypothetical protein